MIFDGVVNTNNCIAIKYFQILFFNNSLYFRAIEKNTTIRKGARPLEMNIITFSILFCNYKNFSGYFMKVSEI